MAAPGHGEEPLTVPSAKRTGEIRPPIGITLGVGTPTFYKEASGSVAVSAEVLRYLAEHGTLLR